MSVAARQLKRPVQKRARLSIVKRRKFRLLKRVSPMLVVMVVFVIAAVFAILLEQVMLAQSGFKMAKLQQKIEKAETKHAELVLEAAKLSSSERIERFAISDLGMVRPERVEYIMANVGVKGAARIAAAPKPEALPATGEAAAELGAPAP